MKLGKIVKSFFFLFVFFFVCHKPALAKGNNFITVVNPVRGEEFLDQKSADPLVGVKFQRQLNDRLFLPTTWLLRDDILASDSIDYFKALKGADEIGLFLEITPGLAKKAEVNYPEGGLFWHDANRIFLSGYKPEDRKKLIDELFVNFKEAFGYFPKSVGAWHVDA